VPTRAPAAARTSAPDASCDARSSARARSSSSRVESRARTRSIGSRDRARVAVASRDAVTRRRARERLVAAPPDARATAERAEVGTR